MNKKFYVPFETAKLLKEKGYPQGDSDMYYNTNGELLTNRELDERHPIVIVRCCFAAPAYCEVIDWLVGKEMYIDIDSTSKGKWYCNIWNGKCAVVVDVTGQYFTREQAINGVIIKALKWIQ